MAVVAGVDYGTLSVRVSIVDSERGRLGSGVAEYPLTRKRNDPDHATQSHADHMRALVEAMHKALASAKVEGADIESIAIDTTGSSVIPVDANLDPIDDYYLWCDHRASREAALITETAHGWQAKACPTPGGQAKACPTGLPAIQWCGGVYSSEWGFSKLLHWLRHNPDKRGRFHTILEQCDMAAATLCGIRDPLQAPRSICRPRSFSPRSIRCSGACGNGSRAATPPAMASPDGCRRNGPPNSGYARASPYRWAPSMLIGTPSGPACRPATW